MKKAWNIFWILILMVGLFACSPTEETTSNGDQRFTPEINRLLKEANVINKSIAQKNMLKYSADRDRTGMMTVLKEISNALVLLRDNSANRDFQELLYIALKELDNNIQLLKIDASTLDVYLNDVREILERISRAYNVNFDDFSWAVFSYDFSDQLYPFVSPDDKWVMDWAMDRGYVKVNGWGVTSWLVSPTFDLTKIRDPQFRIRHGIIINSSSKEAEFNRTLILNTAFKAYVSTDYMAGTNPDDANWTEVSLAPMPSSHDFHTVTSPKVDLSDFIGTNVTIGFKYNMDSSILGRHYPIWQIEKFELLGAGDKVNLQDLPRKLFEHKFTKSTLDPCKTIAMVSNGAQWEAFAPGGVNYKFAKVQSNGKQTDSWMFSPRISLNAKNPSIRFKETVRDPIWSKFEVLVSTNYNGGDPTKASWVNLNRTYAQAIPAGKWTDLVSESIDLAEFQGEDVVFAFRFNIAAGDNTAWELGSFSISGIGEELPVRNLYISYSPAPIIEPTPEPVVGEFASYNFTEGFNGFTEAALSGDPANWKVDTYNGSSKLRMDSYGAGKKVGEQLLYSPTIDLKGKSNVQVLVSQALKYYSGYQTISLADKLVKVQVAEVTGADPAAFTWVDLDFATLPAGMSDDPVDSEWLTLPASVQGKKIAIGFYYKSQDGSFPRWDLYGVTLKEN